MLELFGYFVNEFFMELFNLVKKINLYVMVWISEDVDLGFD